MRLSIIIPTLDSHEVLRRQILYYSKTGLPEGVEIIVVDDGSKPPLQGSLDGLTIYATHDFRPWTQCRAMNIGATLAKGEFIIQSAIDHIITPELMEMCLASRFSFLRFKREFAVIDEHGNFTQDVETLERYGFDSGRIKKRGLRMPPHSGIYYIKRKLYWQIGGTPEDRTTYPQREEAVIRRKISKLVNAGKIELYGDEDRPKVYMFPNGYYCGDKDYNPFGLFHSLSRKKNDGDEQPDILSQSHTPKGEEIKPAYAA